jgi:hypothetical protein
MALAVVFAVRRKMGMSRDFRARRISSAVCRPSMRHVNVEQHHRRFVIGRYRSASSPERRE